MASRGLAGGWAPAGAGRGIAVPWDLHACRVAPRPKSGAMTRPAAPAAAAPPQLSQKEKTTVVLGAMLALFLSALDQTIVATALPTIAGELGDFHLLGWVVTAYLMTSMAATPVLGKLSDLYGRRAIIHLCLAIFLLGSLLCALAPTMLTLILARALQGIGGGGLITMVQTIVADVVSPRERGRYSGYFSAVWAGSALLGPTLGGLLTHYASWPWIFWINLPLGLLSFLIVDRVLKRLPKVTRPARIDWFSILCFSGGATALLLALTWGGVTHPWLSLPVLAAAIGALLLWVCFALRQRIAPEPLIPPHFLKDGVVAPLLLAIFLIFGSYLAVSVLTPTYFQVALGVPAAEVGLLMIPMMLSTTLSAGFAGRWVSRSGRYKRPPLLGLPLAIAALLTLAALAGRADPALAAALLALVGLGIGPIFPITMVAAQNAVQRRDLGAVGGSIGFARALGGAVMTAAASTLILRLIALWLPGTAGLAGLEDLARHPLDGSGQAAVADAFAVLYLVVAVLLAIGTVCFARVEDRPLAGPEAPQPTVQPASKPAE
jgi:EmrB/QacA subfamily drug resistance transporter